MGRATRILGSKTNRVHHFFSDLQLNYFYLLEWGDRVVDIREHYPLLDLEIILKGALERERSKFIDKTTKVPYVLCTNFLITIEDKKGERKFIARSLKSASALKKKISLSGLQIQKSYWEAKNIDWGIVTDKDINIVKARNIKWLHNLLLEKEDFIGAKKGQLERLIYRLTSESGSTREIIHNYENEHLLSNGYGIMLFKILIIQKRILINMNNPIDLNKPISKLTISE